MPNPNVPAILTQAVTNHPMSHMLSPTQRSAAAEAAAPHLKVGNFDEAAQKGIEQVLYGQPITPPTP